MSATLPLPALPQSPDGFYATNNQFLVSGPKGFIEMKLLENDNMYVRMDLPGVAEEGVKVLVDATKRGVLVVGRAKKFHPHDPSNRKYRMMAELVCDCCEMSGVTSHMSDGVLRLLFSKTLISPYHSSCIFFHSGGQDLGEDRPCTDPQDPTLTGPALERHPWLRRGSDLACEYKQLSNGSLYVRLDMPGVPKDNFTVSVNNGIVKVTGEAPAVSHDSSGRFYSGDVAMLSTPMDIPSRRIRTIAKNGVLRLIIPHISP